MILLFSKWITLIYSFIWTAYMQIIHWRNTIRTTKRSQEHLPLNSNSCTSRNDGHTHIASSLLQKDVLIPMRDGFFSRRQGYGFYFRLRTCRVAYVRYVWIVYRPMSSVSTFALCATWYVHVMPIVGICWRACTFVVFQSNDNMTQNVLARAWICKQ